MRNPPGKLPRSAYLSILLAVAAVLAAACAPAAVPTPTPTKAAATPTPAAAPKADATKPAAEPTKPPAPAATTAASKPSGKPIKIGFIAPFTGRLAGLGQRQKIGVQLAVEDINNSGGVNGSPLEIVTTDDAADPRQAVTLVRRLAIEDKVFFIVGPLTSGSFEVAAPLTNELKMPLASATSSKPGITDQNRPWAFRFSVLDVDATPRALDGYKKLYPNVKKMVIVGDTKESVSEFNVKSVYPKALKDAGFEVVDTVAFETGTTDYSAIVTKIKGLNPDGIAYSSLAPEAVGISKELQRQGVKAPVITTWATWGGQEISQAKEAMDGWTTAGVFDQDTQEPKGKNFVERYTKLGEADPTIGREATFGMWAQSYDLVTALADVMRKGNVTPDMDVEKARTAIRDGLQTFKGFKGLSGERATQPNGDISTTPVPFVAKGGKWVLVK